MIKRFILTIAMVIGFSLIIIAWRFNGNFTLINIVDATFIVGIITFFMGLVLLTNAFEIMRSMGYTLKMLMTPRLKRQYENFYDYSQANKKHKEKTTGIPALIIGAIVVIVDIIIAVTQFNI